MQPIAVKPSAELIDSDAFSREPLSTNNPPCTSAKMIMPTIVDNIGVKKNPQKYSISKFFSTEKYL